MLTLRVIRYLQEITQRRALPEVIRVDNGFELIRSKIDKWRKEIKLIFNQPGEPTQGAFIETLNGTLRRDVLNAYVFKSIKKIRNITVERMYDYNYNRPYKSLNNMHTIQIKKQLILKKCLNY